MNELVHFTTGDTRVAHTINIVNDDVCESPHEEFTCRISLVNEDPLTSIVNPLARIMIEDSTELECGMNYCANNYNIWSSSPYCNNMFCRIFDCEL